MTFRLAPPTATDDGLLLAEVVVFRSSENRPLVRSSRPDSLAVPCDEATGEAVSGESLCPGLWAGVDCRGDFLPFPVGVLLPLVLGEGKDNRREWGTVDRKRSLVRS